MFPQYLQHRIKTCALIIICLLLAACSNKQGGQVAQQKGAVITEQKVAEVLDEIDKAARAKDVEAIFKHISEDAKIEVNVQGGGHMTLTRDQYKDYSKQSYNFVGSYEYDRKNTVIKVDADGQSAIASDQVSEAVTTNGRTIRSTTLETAVFKIEDGKVVISSIVGDVFLN